MIQDDGKGFNPDEIPHDHFGLGFMKERADMIGARCTVTSQVGEGTLVHLTIKLQ